MTDSPTHVDVLLGRGVATTRHPGNRRFRSIVNRHVATYATSTKKQKMMISRSIVDEIHAGHDLPGIFLQKEAKTGLWHEVDDKRALEKTAQALRDGALPLRKQLLEDMSDAAFLANLAPDHAPGESSIGTSYKQNKKHRQTTSDDNLPPPKRLRGANLEVERSMNAPIQAPSPLFASNQQHESAEQHHLAHLMLMQQPLPHNVLPSTVIDTIVSSVPDTEVASSMSKSLAQDPPDYCSLLLLKPLQGETEMATLKSHQDTGTLPATACDQTMERHKARVGSLSDEAFLKLDAMDNDWLRVFSEWQSESAQDW